MTTCEKCRQPLPPSKVRAIDRELAREAARLRAAEHAERRIERAKEEAIPMAKRKLRKLSAQHAAEFVAALPHREKYIYAQAEAEDQARTTVLRKLEKYLPNE